MIRRFLHSHFLKFGVVGTGGYLVDVGVLKTMIALGSDKYTGQVIAFLIASVATWLANRLWTFRDRRGRGHIGREWLRYLGVTMGGFCVNFAAYALVTNFGVAGEFLPVAAGSLAGLLFNFPMAKYLVFSSALSALQADHASSGDP